MTIAVIGEEATTSALRTVSLRIAISPKKSPGPRSAMCSSPRTTSAVPFSIEELVAEPSRAHEALPGLDVDLIRLPRHFCPLCLRQAFEQRDPLQVLHVHLSCL